jgi:hypothetical protein
MNEETSAIVKSRNKRNGILFILSYEELCTIDSMKETRNTLWMSGST